MASIVSEGTKSYDPPKTKQIKKGYIVTLTAGNMAISLLTAAVIFIEQGANLQDKDT